MQAAHLPMPAAPAEHIADTAITAVIEQILAIKKGLTSLLITVQTQDSIVQITGFADNLLAQQRAEEIVQAVCRLHSTLCMRLDTLRPNAADPDQALAERIRIYARYNWSSDLHGQEVDVRIKTAEPRSRAPSIPGSTARTVQGTREAGARAVNNHPDRSRVGGLSLLPLLRPGPLLPCYTDSHD